MYANENDRHISGKADQTPNKLALRALDDMTKFVIPTNRHVEKPDNDTKVLTVAVRLCIKYIALQLVTTDNPQGHSPCEHLNCLFVVIPAKAGIQNQIQNVKDIFRF